MSQQDEQEWDLVEPDEWRAAENTFNLWQQEDSSKNRCHVGAGKQAKPIAISNEVATVLNDVGTVERRERSGNKRTEDLA